MYLVTLICSGHVEALSLVDKEENGQPVETGGSSGAWGDLLGISKRIAKQWCESPAAG